jgi:CubicO group peptidase (beta-lactamase class C family)
MKKTFLSLALSVVFLIPQLIFAQTKINFVTLDQQITKAVSDYNLPGMALAIVKNDEILFQKGYGVKNTLTNDRVTVNSDFAIASISKAFAGVCLAMLVEEGKLKWTDKVVNHLPYFKLMDDYATRNMTIRDLVNHNSGFDTFDGDLLIYGTSYTGKEALIRMQHEKPSYDFRQSYGYQNLMFVAAGEVILAASGKSWHDFVNDRIFKPLGMSRSNTSISQYKENQDIAMPHLKGKPQELINYDNWGAAASINSNVNDMSRWIRFWLNQGKLDNQILLKPESISDLHMPRTMLPVYPSQENMGIHFRAYGCGWFMMDYHGRKILEHGGGLPGYISKICLVPEENLGFIILTNGESAITQALMYKLLDNFLATEKTDHLKETLERSKIYEESQKEAEAKRLANRELKSTPNVPFSQFAGTYEDIAYGKAEVILGKKNKLTLKLLPTEKLFTAEMEHWQFNTFKFQFADQFLPFGFANFDFDENNHIKGFSIDLPNNDFHFHKLYFKKL